MGRHGENSLLLESFFERADFLTATRPHYACGTEIDGMTIVCALPKECELCRLGVKAQDIVVAANSQPITNQIVAMGVFNAKELASVTVIRRGQRTVLRK